MSTNHLTTTESFTFTVDSKMVLIGVGVLVLVAIIWAVTLVNSFRRKEY